MSFFTITDENYKGKGGSDFNSVSALSRVVCAKNEKVAFNAVVNTKGLHCLLNPGTESALTNEVKLPRYRIAVQSPLNATVYAVEYIQDEHGIFTADILYPTPVQYKGDQLPQCYIELDVPSQVKADEISVTVSLYLSTGAFDEKKIDEQTILVLVTDAVMPEPSDYRLYLDLWQHTANVARSYKTPMFSQEHYDAVEEVIKALANLGQKSITVLASDYPWRGWGCYLVRHTPAILYEYSFVSIHKKAGKFCYDFSNLLRYIQLCFKHGIKGDITVYGITGIWTNMPLFPAQYAPDYPEKVLVRYLDEDGSFKYMQKAEEIINYIKALIAFFKEHNLFHLVRFGADEPNDLAAFEEHYNLLKSIEPSLQFKMAIDKEKAIPTMGDRLSDIAASFPCSCNHHELLKKQQAQGKRVLMYVCNIPDKPNTVLKSDLAESRVIFFMLHALGYDGFLRWAFTCWNFNPTKNVCYNPDGLPAGDICLVYPAPNGKLYYSLRYKALKRGIEDFELLSRVREKTDEETSLKLVRSIVPDLNFSSYMVDDVITRENLYSTHYSNYANFRAQCYQILSNKEN